MIKYCIYCFFPVVYLVSKVECTTSSHAKMPKIDYFTMRDHKVSSVDFFNFFLLSS